MGRERGQIVTRDRGIARSGSPGARIKPPRERELDELQQLADASPRVAKLREHQGRAARGRRLPAAIETRMSQAFGEDFSDVRVHEGPTAPTAGAAAFTRGNQLHFAPGVYQPHSPAGLRVLGHELAHVVQQRQGRVRATARVGGFGLDDRPELEREADRAGDRAARGQSVRLGSAAIGSRSSARDPLRVNPKPSPSAQSSSAAPIQRLPNLPGPQLPFTDQDLRNRYRAMKRQARQEAQQGQAWASLGPIDVSDNGLDRAAGIQGHQFADAITAARRELTWLRTDRNEDAGTRPGDQTYAQRSMEEWARRTARASGGLDDSFVPQMTRLIYDNWRDDPIPDRRRRSRAKRALRTFGRLNGKMGMRVYGQSSRQSPNALPWNEALEEFAYRINPQNLRHLHPGGRGHFSRLSLTMDLSDASHAARRMHHVVATDLRAYQSKMMGPVKIGQRVDDGVIYLRQPSIRDARAIANRLGLRGPRRGATPPGMEPLAPGVGYAEYQAGRSSSHGENRGEFIQAAVNAQRTGAAGPIAPLLAASLQRGGYDPNRPSLLYTDPAQQALARQIEANAAERRAYLEPPDVDEDDDWLDDYDATTPEQRQRRRETTATILADARRRRAFLEPDD